MANTVINTPELLNLDSTTGATVLAKGTINERPNTAIDGTLRFNTETNKTEYFDGTGWYEIVDEYASGFIGPATNYFDTKLYTGNGTTQSIGGYINGSGSFNGSSSLMTITDGGIGASGTSRVSFTVSLWVNTTASNQSNIISDYGTNYAFYLQMESSASGGAGKLSIASYYTGGLIYTTAGTTAINDGDWHHLVLVNNTSDNTQKLYIDGNTTPAISQALGTGTKTANPIQVGYYTGYVGTYNFDGSIDQIRFYDVALSASDAAALNLETAATATTAAFPSGQTAVATYTMDTSANGLLNTQDLSTVNYPAGAGCIALYEMNGNTNDTSGTYNGTPTNITYEGGAFDQAAVFNGSSSYITTPSIIPANNFSFSVWVNLDVIPTSSSNLQIIYNINRFADNVRWYIAIQANGKIEAWNGANTFITSLNHIVNTGQWYHITYTASSTTGKKIYVNGTEVFTSSDTGNNQGTATTTDWQAFGRYFNASNPFYLDGKLDQARIFNTAISAANVTTLARGIATSYSGASTDVNFNGHLDFAPDFTWLKCRVDPRDHRLFDTVRGATKGLYSNLPNAQFTENSLIAFNTNGFSLGSAGNQNVSNEDYVSWNWKAGGTAVTNNDGNITSQVSANKDSGFSIVKWVASSTASDTIGSGLGKKVEFLVTKENTNRNWNVWHKDLPNNGYLHLNTTNAEMTPNGDRATVTNNTTFTAEGTSGESMFAYCWHSVAGYSKIGSYSGTAASGNSIVTGFAPAFILFKRTDAGDRWLIADTKRADRLTDMDDFLDPQDAAAEGSFGATNGINFLNNGFSINTTDGVLNASGGTYIYMAIA